MLKKLPRVAAVHDVSGYGKCALTVAIPTLSAAGVEVCPLPTALLSTNTLFEGFTFFDFSPHMDAYLDHWQSLGLKFDAVYSGFLGSAYQMQVVARLIQNFPTGMGIIDPVMGDNGIVIKTYTPQMCREMANLVAVADLATPNITEACLLTGREYQNAELDSAQAEELCREIVDLGCKSVVLTGVIRGEMLYNCALAEGRYFEREIGLLPFHMHGTGDLFTSTLTAGLMRGYSLEESVDSAALFVRDAMLESKDVEDAFERGVAFELLLHKLGKGLYLHS
ncbi:MAG: pyridoxamine kinase [Clostridiales bacterium]|nr:pyridoxamine kinase [Clostridiales bacterium]MDR2713878.1 pyridoxamine kinase [Clostridiales bacterium]